MVKKSTGSRKLPDIKRSHSEIIGRKLNLWRSKSLLKKKERCYPEVLEQPEFSTSTCITLSRQEQLGKVKIQNPCQASCNRRMRSESGCFGEIFSMNR